MRVRVTDSATTQSLEDLRHEDSGHSRDETNPDSWQNVPDPVFTY